MLRIQKLTPGGGGNGASYYTDLAATELSEYYTGTEAAPGEAPGVWFGGGLEEFCIAMGLDPIVAGQLMNKDAGELFEYLNSRPCVQQLFPSQRVKVDSIDANWVSGFDFTFTAPKGISMLATMTDNDELRQAIYDAWNASILTAMEIAEDMGCFGREGTNGVILVKGGGFIGAEFRHRTARPAAGEDIPDPHLHTHAVISNIVRHPDGTYGALDARAFTERANSFALTIGAEQQVQFIQELSNQGISFDWVSTGKNGTIDIDGIDPELLAAFSSRTAEIDAELDASGLDGTKAGDVAQKKTRLAKDKEVARANDHRLAEMLDAKLISKGGTLDKLHSCIHWHSRPQLSAAELDALAQTLIAPIADFERQGIEVPPEHLTMNRATFTYSDALGALARSAQEHADAKDIRAAVDRLLGSPDVRELERATLALPWRARYSTPEILSLEGSVIDLLRPGATKFSRLNMDDINQDGFTDDQKAACKFLAGDTRTVTCVVGAAGSGKTYVFGRLREAWEAKGIEVIGCAKSARAADELERSSGIPSDTLDHLLINIKVAAEKGEVYLADHCVVTVDESSMAETRQLAKLAEAIQLVGGKMILAGDTEQLGSVAAGGLFAHLVDLVPHATLTENVRNRAEAAVLADLRLGKNTTEIVQGWVKAGRLHVSQNQHDSLTNMVADWEGDLAQGKDSIMLASKVLDVAMLNDTAHKRRVERAEIEGEREIGDRYFGVGDKVMAVHNSRKLLYDGGNERHYIKNGDMGIITAISDSGVTIDTSRGAITVPLAYAAKYLDYGYARTTHKSQGMTCEMTRVFASSAMAKETGYVAASRATDATHFYCESKVYNDLTSTDHGYEIADERSAEERLSDRLAVSQNEKAASAYIAAGVSFDISDVLLTPDEITQARRDTSSTDIEVSAAAAGKLAWHRKILGWWTSIDPPAAIVARLGRRPALSDDRKKWQTSAAEMMMPPIPKPKPRTSEVPTTNINPPAKQKDLSEASRKPKAKPAGGRVHIVNVPHRTPADLSR
jgi:conjugative relaxase-like TrwC/TraI family protein